MRRQNLRELIIQVAGDLFSRHGYGNIGINEIIEKGSIARASFYHHFKSKEALCAAWLDSLHQKSIGRHASLLSSELSKSDVLDSYFKDLKDWLAGNEYRGCPFSNTSSFLQNNQSEIWDVIHSHKIHMRDFFIEIAMGLDLPHDARKSGDFFYLLYSGATTEAQNHRASWPVDRALDVIETYCKLQKNKTG